MKSLLLSALFSVCAYITYAQPSAGLVAHWDMNGTTNDVSGGGHNGHGNNLTPAPGSDGVMGHAWYFNGVNSSITVPYSPAFNVTNYSIAAKLNVKGFYSGPCHYNMIFLRGHTPGGSGGDYYYLAFSDAPAGLGCSGALDSNLECFSTTAYSSTYWMGPSSPSAYNYTPHIVKDVWYDVVATFNDTVYKLYVNGVLKSTAAITTPGSPIPAGTDSAYIGLDMIDAAIGYSYAFKGYMDDIMLYNRVLTDTEIVHLYDTCGVVTMNPANDSASVGGIVTYSVDASISGAIYQWQVNSGAGFTNLSNGGVYSGVTTNTLTVTGVTTSMSGNLYRCVIANASDMPCVDTSIAASLTVSPLGVLDYGSNQFLAIYPNPVKNNLTIMTSVAGGELAITNMVGQTVYRKEVRHTEMIVNMAEFPAGVYLIELSSEQGKQSLQKFIKE